MTQIVDKFLAMFVAIALFAVVVALIVGIDRIESLEVKIGARTFSGRVERRKETVSSWDDKGKEVTEEKVRET